ncbi:phosphoketolase [Methylicorpusculum sp.]|uniref:phosphoketolase family protein n=2 Tax=Methylicorpusculum sp. TaxID=2713644 RepID=UPI0027318570|nr:phosphoketolase family protein [Methylicorpusculum sp.]MDP2178071.1 phosphoketolase family protein [Methylicorpusculum sp.]MDP3529035.1 phosphoketolase family protein [Methylicorpusculum sp.]
MSTWEHAHLSNSGSGPLDQETLRKIHAWWCACNYLSVGMIYLKDNPLLKEPLTVEHIKHRLLGHWGASPALSFTWAHLNRLIKEQDLDVIFIAGPGHGAPGVLGPSYLEETYSEVYPDKSLDEEGLRKFFKQFSFPGHIGSHVTPETPGSIHEGGELGYSLSHAYGAAFDNPDLIVACVVGDGEAETGPLATAWHSNKFLNPQRDGAVLPILNLNGYKIANPTILARISHQELEALFMGYGYRPYFVEGDDPADMHQKMAATLNTVIGEIKAIQHSARSGEKTTLERPFWPMIVLRSPKGWSGPKTVKGHKAEGSWRSHQVPFSDVRENPESLKLLEDWLLSYEPAKLFDGQGRLVEDLRSLAPQGTRRMSANLHANGGMLRKELKMPDFRQYAVEVKKAGGAEYENTKPLGEFLRDTLSLNAANFRVFGPDETASNRLQAVFEASKKCWMADYLPEDADGGELSQDGRVMEMLSEHTLIGWMEGYLLSGRHGFFHTYEAFAHVIDSMINQHAKWLAISNLVAWRASVASENILLSSTVWRQDHNGFSHQDPGFIDLLTNKSPQVTRIYLPPDANTLLVVADHCLRSTDKINVIVADKQKHLQFTTIDEAVVHCAKGIGIWSKASNDQGEVPDVVMASCGDVATQEALAATAILRAHVPELKLRFVNVVDLFKLQPATEHPHGLSHREFDSLFTTDKPVIFNFHGYPWLIHKLAYRFTNHDNLHVRGYKERGNINTPMELAILNQIDRFNLVIDVIDRVPWLSAKAAHLKEQMKNEIIDNLSYAHEHGTDKSEIANWTWPFD